MLDLYRRWLSPLLHSVSGFSGACRFQPTCSEYAFVALSRHGVFSGAALALWRVLRCNPFAQGGLDPVPGTSRPPSFPDARCSLVASLNWRLSSMRLSSMRLSLKNGFLSRAAHRKSGFPHR